jgi:hypothetical protein
MANLMLAIYSKALHSKYVHISRDDVEFIRSVLKEWRDEVLIPDCDIDAASYADLKNRVRKLRKVLKP